MNYEQRLERIETTLTAVQKALAELQPLPTLTDEHSPEVVRPQWEAIPQEEKKAGWWKVECGGVDEAFWLLAVPDWSSRRYRIVKTAAHPENDRHARVKLEWRKVKDAGTHELWSRYDGDGVWRQTLLPMMGEWSRDFQFEIRPIAKKRIDKTRLPIGAMTNFGRLTVHKRGSCRCCSPEHGTWCAPYENLRIVPMSQWEVLREGDAIPEGLIVSFADCFDGLIKIGTNYKIIGLKDGWTDE
jgi:hypothetical protein